MIDEPERFLLKPPTMPSVKPLGTMPPLLQLDAANGWLDLRGDLIPCSYSGHDDLAYELIPPGVTSSSNQYGGLKTSSELLEELGYIKLQNQAFYSPYNLSLDDDWYVNKYQYNFIQHYWKHRNVAKHPYTLRLK